MAVLDDWHSYVHKIIQILRKVGRISIKPKDRSRWEIILDVLKVVHTENKAKKTRIMHGAYLDWRNFERYHDFLLEESFMAKSNPEHGMYNLTEKGEELLSRLKEVERMLG